MLPCPGEHAHVPLCPAGTLVDANPPLLQPDEALRTFCVGRREHATCLWAPGPSLSHLQSQKGLPLSPIAQHRGQRQLHFIPGADLVHCPQRQDWIRAAVRKGMVWTGWPARWEEETVHKGQRSCQSGQKIKGSPCSSGPLELLAWHSAWCKWQASGLELKSWLSFLRGIVLDRFPSMEPVSSPIKWGSYLTHRLFVRPNKKPPLNPRSELGLQLSFQGRSVFSIGLWFKLLYYLLAMEKLVHLAMCQFLHL